jgi:hypothetical protein
MLPNLTDEEQKKLTSSAEDVRAIMQGAGGKK